MNPIPWDPLSFLDERLPILYYTILYYTILYYTILYYNITILYYTITILYYTILYYIRHDTIRYDTVLLPLEAWLPLAGGSWLAAPPLWLPLANA